MIDGRQVKLLTFVHGNCISSTTYPGLPKFRPESYKCVHALHLVLIFSMVIKSCDGLPESVNCKVDCRETSEGFWLCCKLAHGTTRNVYCNGPPRKKVCHFYCLTSPRAIINYPPT